MSLQTRHIEAKNIFQPAFEACQRRFLHMLNILFYAEVDSAESDKGTAEEFTKYLTEIREKYTINSFSIERIEKLYSDFNDLYNSHLSTSSKRGHSPKKEEFEKLSSLYELLTNHLHRLEIECMSEDAGIDSFTGLRNRKVMMPDIQQEIQRLVRHGKPFCIGLGIIDDFDDLEYKTGSDEPNSDEAGEDMPESGDGNILTLKVASIIKQTLRNFDDAYRMNDREFVFALKQTDVVGGMAAMERFGRLVEEERIPVVINGKQDVLSVSCGVAEVIGQDDIDELLENLRKDITNPHTEKGAVVQYHELSSLERYIKSQ